jgi:hypothetical protein
MQALGPAFFILVCFAPCGLVILPALLRLASAAEAASC